MDRIEFGVDAFYIGDDDNRLAEITFAPIGKDKFIVEQTFVSEEIRGQGVGTLLVDCLAEHARESHKRVIPKCPFVKAILEKHMEYDDVLQK